MMLMSLCTSTCKQLVHMCLRVCAKSARLKCEGIANLESACHVSKKVSKRCDLLDGLCLLGCVKAPSARMLSATEDENSGTCARS